MGYYTDDEAREETEREVTCAWHGVGRYQVRWSDGGQPYDARHYGSPEELADDVFEACCDATETHLPYVEALPSKADVRAERERMGLSQTEVAERVGVQTRTVKRWEDPGSRYEPPQDLIDTMDELADEWERAVREGMATAHALLEQTHAGHVTLTYWKHQEQYDELRGDDGYYGMANSITREIARMLRAEGVEVSYEYPESDANPYHRAARELGEE